MRARAFTLLELLVAIGVIATLLGILAPALGSARRTAQTAVCASNLRQLAIALEAYASEHQSRYAPGAADFLRNRDRWHGQRGAATGPFDGSLGPLASYLGETPSVATAAHSASGGAGAMVRECPAFTDALDALRAASFGFESSCGGYGYNNAFVGVERAQLPDGSWDVRTGPGGVAMDTTGSPRARFAQPARTVAFADSALAHARSPATFGGTRLIEYSFIEPVRWPQFPSARPDPSVHFRHAGGRASVAWLDGHVAGETMARGWTSGVYTRTPARDIGWFGASDSNELFDYD